MGGKYYFNFDSSRVQFLNSFLKFIFQDHEKKCEYVLVPCSFKECVTRIQQKVELIEAHNESCIYRPVLCSYCNETIQFWESRVRKSFPNYTSYAFQQTKYRRLLMRKKRFNSFGFKS